MSENEQLMVRRDVESPPGGWSYTPPETGVTIKAPFFRDLFYKVRQHLAANGKEDPFRDDIEDGACRETNPGGSWCGKRPPKPVEGKLPFLSLSMVERFVLSVIGAVKAKKLVKREEAERRFAICMNCPLSTSIGGCTGCYGTLKLIEKAMAKNPLPDPEDKRFCGACGCVIRLKVWILSKVLDDAEKVRPRYWEGCWRHETNRVSEP